MLKVSEDPAGGSGIIGAGLADSGGLTESLHEAHCPAHPMFLLQAIESHGSRWPYFPWSLRCLESANSGADRYSGWRCRRVIFSAPCCRGRPKELNDEFAMTGDAFSEDWKGHGAVARRLERPFNDRKAARKGFCNALIPRDSRRCAAPGAETAQAAAWPWQRPQKPSPGRCSRSLDIYRKQRQS